MAITYVGGKTASHNVSSQTISLTDLTGGSDAAPATGDIVIVINGHPEVSDTDVSVTTTGYTNQELYANDTRDANGAFCYKVMGGTPDTDVTVPATTSSAAEGSTVIKVFRGVDTITPLDVAVVTATGTNGTEANGAAITPVTSGAKILMLGHGTHPFGSSAAITGPANMSAFLTISASGGGRSSWAGIAEADWTSGAFDPDAVTGGAGTANDSWVAFSVALRPAAGGGAQTITGAAYSDSDTFGAGTVGASYAITGAVLSDADSFGAGTVGTSYTITGVGYSDSDSFGAGAISTAYTITGAAFSDGDTFGAGTITQPSAQTITGAAFVDLDAFGAGVVAFPSTADVDQPGGWLPVKYVDRKGREVDLSDVREAVAEATEEIAAPAAQARAVAVSGRVLDALALRTEPRREDVRALRRLLADYQDAISALNDALLAQQLLDDEITILLLAS